MFVVRDGKELGTYDLPDDSFLSEDGAGRFLYSSDGKSLSFTINKNGKAFVVKDGKTFGPYEYVHAPAFYVPNTQALIFIGQKNGWQYIVKDGVETKGNYPAYSPDGKNLAFVGYEQVSGKPVIMKDGTQNAKYDFVDSPSYSADSKSFAFIARKDQNSMVAVKDGAESTKFASISSVVYFSPDGNAFAFVAQKTDMRGADTPDNTFVVVYRKK